MKVFLTRFTIFALSAFFAFPLSASEPGSFFDSGIRMGTSYCRDAAFECDNIGLQQTEIIEAANRCIEDRFNIEEPIMTETGYGEYENCVLPSGVVPNARGFGTWAVCCVKKKNSGEGCNLYCTRYIDQKKK